MIRKVLFGVPVEHTQERFDQAFDKARTDMAAYIASLFDTHQRSLWVSAPQIKVELNDGEDIIFSYGLRIVPEVMLQDGFFKWVWFRVCRIGLYEFNYARLQLMQAMVRFEQALDSILAGDDGAADKHTGSTERLNTAIGTGVQETDTNTHHA